MKAVEKTRHTGQASIELTCQCFDLHKDAYYLLRQTAKHNKVIEKLSQLMSIMDILPMDRDIIIQALGSGFKDFEDALQNFAAIKSGFIDVILTRNVKDYIKSDIGVLTPESNLKSISASH